jgi:signal transduction histidine kinase/ligand-binding sensor domain-containing protein
MIQRGTRRAPAWLIIAVAVLVPTKAESAASAARLPSAALPIQVHVDPGIVRIPVTDGSDVRFSHVSLAQGLSQSRVTGIVQDDLGFLWFATQYGLDRYDGYRFRVYVHHSDEPQSLCGVYIYSLLEDRSGNIWIGCNDALDRYDPTTDSFQRFPILGRSGSPVSVKHISQGRSGMLWLSTMQGLYRFDPRTGRTLLFRHEAHDPQSLSSNDVEFAADDREGHLWVATSKGLDEFDWRHDRVLIHVPLRQARGLAFFEDSRGVFWIYYASGNGLAVLNRRTDRLRRYSFLRRIPPGHPLTGVSSMIEDSAGTLWIGTFSDGLLRYDRRDHRFIRYRHNPTRPDSITENRITTLYEDREGSIWVGLGASPPCFFSPTPLPFRSLPFDATDTENLGERLVNAILVDHDGVLWTGTTGLLNSFDPRTGRDRHFIVPGEGIASDVLSIAEQPSGTLWVGTSGQGLARLNEHTGRFVLYRHRQGDPRSLSSNTVPALLIGQRGRIWLGTLDGLDELDRSTGRFRVYRPGSHRATAQFTSLAQGRNGSLWIGSPSSGLLHFNVRTHRFKVYYHHRGRSDTLSNDRVNGVMVSRSGAVWVSTQNGLDRLNPGTGRFTDYYERNGLAGNAVSCTLQDRLGDIWAGTADGLSRLDPWTGRFRNYGEGEGLPGPDLTGWHACFRTPGGQMYFGGFSGAVTFRPRRVKTSRRIPPVVLTQFDLDGAPVALGPGSPLRRSIDYTRKIVLPHNDDNFSFSFAALSFRNPLTNRYRYRLLGLQGAWHEAASDQRTASYTTLGPGKYRFEVEGATLRSPWSPVTGVSIDILRPWWQTWWFKLAAIIALIIGNVMAYFLHIRRLAHQMEIRFEERVAERASIAQDLHDSLLQGFQGLMFSLQAVRKMLPDDPQQAGRALERALERGDESIAEARDAVRSLRAPKSDTDLIDALKTLAGEFAAGDEIGAPSFRVIAEGRPRPISPWVRDEVYQISREALRNAHRHAQAKNLEAEIIFGASALTVRVRDDGIGLDREILERGMRTGHWGLPGMRERAARIGGSLSLWSEMKAGTEIEVTIPAAIAYRKTHERANRLDQE